MSEITSSATLACRFTKNKEDKKLAYGMLTKNTRNYSKLETFTRVN